jgi:hypothetical protein
MVNWWKLATKAGYESVPVALLDLYRQHGFQRGAALLGVSQATFYRKFHDLGLRGISGVVIAPPGRGSKCRR